ncbi:hypothetical protein BH10ACT6_BH10ACT6_12700 [soil metagenome]
MRIPERLQIVVHQAPVVMRSTGRLEFSTAEGSAAASTLDPRWPERCPRSTLGTNKRYADAIDRRMNERIVESVIAGQAVHSLTNDELELETQPLTKPPVPRPVRAWVRFGPVAVKAEAVAWTERAVAIRWTMASGAEHRAWVWASAVEPR